MHSNPPFAASIAVCRHLPNLERQIQPGISARNRPNPSLPIPITISPPTGSTPDKRSTGRGQDMAKPYATSDEALDRDLAIREEVRIAVRTLLEAVQARRAGPLVSAGDGLEQPRQK